MSEIDFPDLVAVAERLAPIFAAAGWVYETPDGKAVPGAARIHATLAYLANHFSEHPESSNIGTGRIVLDRDGNDLRITLTVGAIYDFFGSSETE